MFKRIVPLASATLLLFSCGGSQDTPPTPPAPTPTTIDINIPSFEISLYYISEDFNAKKGESVTFSFSYSIINPELRYIVENEKGGMLSFYKGDFAEETGAYVNLIDENEDVKVLYNDESFDKTDLSAEEWLAKVEEEEDPSFNKTFYCGVGPYGIEYQILCYCHLDTDVDNDNVKFTIKFADDYEAVKAVFMPAIPK